MRDFLEDRPTACEKYLSPYFTQFLLPRASRFSRWGDVYAGTAIHHLPARQRCGGKDVFPFGRLKAMQVFRKAALPLGAMLHPTGSEWTRKQASESSNSFLK
jgi:hypothetical protein